MPAQSKPGPMLAVVAGTLTVTRLTFNGRIEAGLKLLRGRSMDSWTTQKNQRIFKGLIFHCYFSLPRVYRTLPKFNSSPLKSYRNPIGKLSSNYHFFRGYVKLRGCIHPRKSTFWTWKRSVRKKEQKHQTKLINSGVQCFRWRSKWRHRDWWRWNSAWWDHKLLVGGWTNPCEKYLSNWIISPNRGENKKCLKPPPRWVIAWTRGLLCKYGVRRKKSHKGVVVHPRRIY